MSYDSTRERAASLRTAQTPRELSAAPGGKDKLSAIPLGLAWRPELAGHPADGVRLHRVDGERKFLDQAASAALESALLKATLAW